MERTYTTSKFSWFHEITPAVRLVPPEMKALLDDEGNPVIDEAGEPVQVPDTDNWERQMEEIDLETMVFIDQSDQANPSVFKFAVDKEFLGRILSYYVQYLDANGRVALREAISKASGIEVPKVDLGNLTLFEQ